MTMKKYMLIITCVTILALCLTGCSDTSLDNTYTRPTFTVIRPTGAKPLTTEEKHYEKYDCFVLDATSGVGAVKPEYIINFLPFFSESAPEEMEITGLNGEKIKGIYMQTQDLFDYFFETHTYKCEDSSEFSVRSDNGKISSVFYMDKDYLDTMRLLPDIEDHETECLRIAKEAASKFINVDEYAVIEGKPYKYSGNNTYVYTRYTHTFMKKINGINTNDKVSVTVNSKGLVQTIHIGRTNEFDKYKDYEVPMEKCNEIVLQKCKELYGDEFISVDVNETTLSLNKENRLSLLIDTTVNITRDASVHDASVILLIILE